MSDHKRRHDKSGSSKAEKVFSSSKYQDYEEKYSKQRRSQSYDTYYEAVPKTSSLSKSSKKRAHSPKATQFYKEKASFKDKGSYSGQSSAKAYYRSRSSSQTPPRNKRCRSSYSMSPPPPPPSRSKAPSYNEYAPSHGTSDWDTLGSKACMSMRPGGGMNGGGGYSGDYYNNPPPSYSGYEGDGGYGYVEGGRGRSSYTDKSGLARGSERGYHDDTYSSGYRDGGYPAEEYEPAPSYSKPASKYDHYDDYSEPKGGTTQLSRYVIGDSVVYGPPGHYPQGLLSRSPSPAPRRDRYERFSRPGRGSPSPPPRQPTMGGDYHPVHPSGGSNYPLRRAPSPNNSGYDGRREEGYDVRRRSMSPPPPSAPRHPPSSAYDTKYGEAMAGSGGSSKSRRPPSPPSYPSRSTGDSRPTGISERLKASVSGIDLRDRDDHLFRRKDRAPPPPSPPPRRKRSSDGASPRRVDRPSATSRQEGSVSKKSSSRHVHRSRSRSPLRPLASHSSREDRSREAGSRNEHRADARNSREDRRVGGRNSQNSREGGKGSKSLEDRRESLESRRNPDDRSGQKSRDNSRPSDSKDGKTDVAAEASTSKANGSSNAKKKPLLSTPPRAHMLPMKPPLLSTPPVLPLPTPNPPPLMGVRPMLGGFPPLLGRPPGPPLFDAPPPGAFQRHRPPFDGLRTGRQGPRGRDGRLPLRRPMDLRGLIEQRKQPMQHDGNRTSQVGSRGSGPNMRQDGRSLNSSMRQNSNNRDNRPINRGTVTSRTYDSRGSGGGRQQLSNRLQQPHGGRLQSSTNRNLSSSRNQSGGPNRLLSGSNVRSQGVRNRTQSGGRAPTSRNPSSRSVRSPVRTGRVGGGRVGAASSNRTQQTGRAPARPVQANVAARRTNILRKYQRLTVRRRAVGGRGTATKNTSAGSARTPLAARKRPLPSSSSRPQQRSRVDDTARRDSSASNRKQHQAEKTKSSQLHSPRKTHKNRKSSPMTSSRYSRSPRSTLKATKKRPAPLSRSPSSSGSSSPDSRDRRRASSSPHYSKSPRHSKFARSSPGYVPSNSRSTKRSSPAPSKYSKSGSKSFKRSRMSRSLTRSPTTSPSVSPDRKSASLSLTP